MKSAVKIFIIALCALAVTASYAIADDNPTCKSCMMKVRDKMSKQMDLDDMFYAKARCILANAEELGLTEEQVDKIKAMKYSVKRSLIKKEADIDTYALDIKEALWKDAPDLNAVNGMIDKKYAIKAEKAKELVAACVNIKGMLTKEQYKKLKDMRAKCGKMGKMGHCPMCGKMGMMHMKGMDKKN